jgi:hypothetical protein
MRTTLTLDPDVVALLEQEGRRLRKPFKQIVNEALRRALTGGRGPRPARYVLVPQRGGLAAGVDAGALNRLADELEDEAFSAKRRR